MKKKAAGRDDLHLLCRSFISKTLLSSVQLLWRIKEKTKSGLKFLTDSNMNPSGHWIMDIPQLLLVVVTHVIYFCNFLSFPFLTLKSELCNVCISFHNVFALRRSKCSAKTCFIQNDYLNLRLCLNKMLRIAVVLLKCFNFQS